MFRKASKTLLKQTLRLSRARLLYTRITLTPFTTLYFFVALISCVILVILQGVTYVDNSAAVRVLDSILSTSNTTRDLAIFSNGALKVCTRLPEHPETDCVVIASSFLNSRRDLASEMNLPSIALSSSDMLSGPNHPHINHFISHHDDTHGSKADKEDVDDEDKDEDKTEIADRKKSENKQAEAANVEIGHSQNCLLSLSWLEDVLHDAKREDIVTLAFHFWLFSLSIVTILNESLPHLGAALLAHVLAAGWASFRVQSSEKLADMYRGIIVPGPCEGIDHLQDWWEMRRLHAIPILAMNVLTLLVIAFVSFKLFKVYATQTFGRVGASVEIYTVYKLVLCLSLGLQLSAFFTLAFTSMWIDKICHGVVKNFADHRKLYLATFIIILLLQLPWLIMGWVCVRRECSIRFAVFCSISLFILAISTLFFFSPLYRFIFMTWPFFATITVTSYILLVLTSVLAILCRLNFGHGLAHYLQVNEVLEGVDFTPVYFSNGSQEVDSEESLGGMEKQVMVLTDPPGAYHPLRKGRGSSIYSEAVGVPIHLSSTLPLLSDLTPKPGHTSFTSTWTSRSRRVSDLTHTRGVRGSGQVILGSAQASQPTTRVVARGLPENPRPVQVNGKAVIGENF